MLRSLALMLFGLCVVTPAQLEAGKFEVTQEKDGVTIKLNGKLLTRYLIKSGHKPIFWPVIGPNGKEVTRAYPMREGNPDERKDHHHHRSFWFTHGNVNGIDFWAESADAGHIIQQEFLTVKGGATAVISTRNAWMSTAGKDGKKQCEDVRTFTFGADDDSWWVDCDIEVQATDGKVVFGDTKEGSFGVRVAGTMKPDAKKGGVLINSEGQMGKDAWGKRAAWVDYNGPVEGEHVGIAILNHPSSFRYPTWWHARTYGLFTANPFGLHHFERNNDLNGSHTLQQGKSFSLHHRVLFHKGDEKAGKVAEEFARYAKTTPVLREK